ncbi:peptidoglycan-binding protein [Spirulina subsalsa FACHB-351]|uniref:Peptidoglycan-binding protein n=1 Tax=Spirulina subsalsa FACHB-351 TaxID=234711 RepID=A0ABT3L0I7_9CYAN|nr:peptidoglycan-binding domain-containing protein [Spirulina subsalsa]MCW6035013.1 peptidoglycan-binding protein [Spirulina subsalsa FACHB-351]
MKGSISATQIKFPILSEPLRLGSEGRFVKVLQLQLESQGFFLGRVDGVFGRNTLAAVRAFQAEFGLSIDGVVGAATWRNLGGEYYGREKVVFPMSIFS